MLLLLGMQVMIKKFDCISGKSISSLSFISNNFFVEVTKCALRLTMCGNGQVRKFKKKQTHLLFSLFPRFNFCKKGDDFQMLNLPSRTPIHAVIAEDCELFTTHHSYLTNFSLSFQIPIYLLNLQTQGKKNTN